MSQDFTFYTVHSVITHGHILVSILWSFADTVRNLVSSCGSAGVVWFLVCAPKQDVINGR